MRLAFLLLTTTVLLFAAGGPTAVSPPPKSPAPVDVESLLRRISKLEAALTAVKADVQTHDDVINELIDHVNADFDTGDLKGYQTVDTEFGRLFLKIIEVTPYLDGYEVAVAIGNPWTLTLSGIDLKIQWGPRYSVGAGDGSFLNWMNKKRSKSVTLTDQITPGAWTTVRFTLPETTPPLIGHINLSVTLNSVRFGK